MVDGLAELLADIDLRQYERLVNFNEGLSKSDSKQKSRDQSSKILKIPYVCTTHNMKPLIISNTPLYRYCRLKLPTSAWVCEVLLAEVTYTIEGQLSEETKVPPQDQLVRRVNIDPKPLIPPRKLSGIDIKLCRKAVVYYYLLIRGRKGSTQIIKFVSNPLAVISIFFTHRGLFYKSRSLGCPGGMRRKSFSSRNAQGGAANWYLGITWAHRSRWRHSSVVKRQFNSFGRIMDPFRLWALFKSRGKQEIAGFCGR